MKTFNRWELATIKRTAQSVNAMVTKKSKLKARIDELQEEYNELETAQEQYEAPIRTMTGGYTTEDLVDKVKGTNGLTQYVFKYPDTIVPQAAEEIEEISLYEVDYKATVDEVEVPAGTDIFDLENKE